MKTITSSRKFFHCALATALAIVITCGLSLRTVQGGYIVTLQQVGPDVVATGSGALDLTGLSFAISGLGGPVMTPSQAAILTGSFFAPDDLYRGLISGPTNFGSGFIAFGNSATGDLVGIAATTLGGVLPTVYVPAGYVSNSLVSDSATYNNGTFGSVGVTPGTYKWTWGAGADQNFTLQIGPAAVPDSGSTFGLLMVSFVALFGITRFRSLRLT